MHIWMFFLNLVQFLNSTFVIALSSARFSHLENKQFLNKLFNFFIVLYIISAWFSERLSPHTGLWFWSNICTSDVTWLLVILSVIPNLKKLKIHVKYVNMSRIKQKTLKMQHYWYTNIQWLYRLFKLCQRKHKQTKKLWENVLNLNKYIQSDILSWGIRESLINLAHIRITKRKRIESWNCEWI